MSYIGNEPIVSATRTVTEITATNGQSTFTANGGYTVGFIDVFVNGVQLTASDFTATNGSTVVLNDACVTGDSVRLVAWGVFNTANITSGSLSAGGITWSQSGGVTLPRIDSSNEGGQLNFNRASDNTATWSIDSFGNTSTPTLRFIDGANVRAVIDGSGNVGIGTSSPTNKVHIQQTSAASSVTQLVLQNADNSTGTGSALGFANHTSAGLLTGKVEGAIDGANAYSMRFYTYQSGLNERMRLDASGNLLFNSGYGSVATAYGCRAWVNFNGTTSSPSTIRGSGNVTSVTKSQTGIWVVNFTNSMPDGNYSVALAARYTNNGSTDGRAVIGNSSTGMATSSVQVAFLNASDTALIDPVVYCVSVFR